MRYKTLKSGLKSGLGDCTWIVGEWRRIDGPLALCVRGFHCSERILDAMGYVAPDAIAEVDVAGNHIDADDKQVWSEMRLVRVWEWTKIDSVALAVFSARKVLHLYEKRYRNDDRVRKAIEAAEKWVENPTVENESAARSAGGKAKDEIESWIRQRIGIVQ